MLYLSNKFYLKKNLIPKNKPINITKIIKNFFNPNKFNLNRKINLLKILPLRYVCT